MIKFQTWKKKTSKLSPSFLEISKTQDDEVGDGTTSVTVLTAELLREAEKLIDQKIHPQTIIEGYRLATKAAYEALVNASVNNASNQGFNFLSNLLP